MGRILAIDYGRRRCGLAVTDPLRIVATALATVDTPQLVQYLKDYLSRETVDTNFFLRPKSRRCAAVGLWTRLRAQCLSKPQNRR